MASLLLCFLLLLPAVLRAHELRYEVAEGRAVSVQIFSSSSTGLAGQAYEIYRPGEKDEPFQSGRTDAHGRLVFLPDRPGEWRITVFSEDGHGLDFLLRTDASGTVEPADRPLLDRHAGLVIGVALIFGLFGLVNLTARRRFRHPARRA